MTESKRLVSMDLLRGFTVLVMLYVNDVGGVARIPGWMRHLQPPHGDGMTFVDVVFPAFLFLVGMALPYALGRRLDRGTSLFQVLRHLGARTFALLVLGVFMVNAEGLDFSWRQSTWTLLMYGGAMLAWHQWKQPGTLNRRLRIAGSLLLVLAAFLFRAPQPSGAWIQLTPQWWGILGLIGWANLAAALVYLPFRRAPMAILAAIALAYAFSLADAVGHPAFLAPLRPHLALGAALGTHGGIVLSGTLLGMMVSGPLQGSRERIRWALGFAAGLALAALLLHGLAPLHRIFTYNKILGTPAWGLMASAWTAALWALAYWLVDVKGIRRGLGFLETTGTCALSVYLLAPVVLCLLTLAGHALAGRDVVGGLSASPWTGVPRAIGSALLTASIAVWATRRGLTLRI